MKVFQCPKCDSRQFVIDEATGEAICNNTVCDYIDNPHNRKLAQPLPGHPEFHKIIGEMQALHAKKAADYGLGADVLANCRGSAEFGIPAWIGVVMRMNDKMTRLKAFAQKGSLANESVEDSLLDLSCYAIIALILYREQSK